MKVAYQEPSFFPFDKKIKNSLYIYAHKCIIEKAL